MTGYSHKVYFILSQQVRVLVQMKYLAFVLALGDEERAELRRNKAGRGLDIELYA